MGKISSKESNKILIIGPKSSGKTTLLIKIVSKEYDQTVKIDTTFGFNVEKIEVNKKPFLIFDTAGLEDINFVSDFF